MSVRANVQNDVRLARLINFRNASPAEELVTFSRQRSGYNPVDSHRNHLKFISQYTTSPF